MARICRWVKSAEAAPALGAVDGATGGGASAPGRAVMRSVIRPPRCNAAPPRRARGLPRRGYARALADHTIGEESATFRRGDRWFPINTVTRIEDGRKSADAV